MVFGASCVAARFTRLPLVLIVGAMATIWVCLGRAVSIYSATHTMHWPHSPPISGLAESAEGFVWFSTGFMLLSLLMGGALCCRAAHISAAHSADNLATPCLNVVWITLALIATLCFIIMGFNRDDGPTSSLHFACAGLGMGCICLSGILHALLCLSIRVDRMMPAACLRASLYVGQLLALVTGGVCFGLWLVGDKSSAALEWAGFICTMAAYGTYAIYFLYPPFPMSNFVTHSREELLAARGRGRWGV